jgi:hypothetical protein
MNRRGRIDACFLRRSARCTAGVHRSLASYSAYSKMDSIAATGDGQSRSLLTKPLTESQLPSDSNHCVGHRVGSAANNHVVGPLEKINKDVRRGDRPIIEHRACLAAF